MGSNTPTFNKQMNDLGIMRDKTENIINREFREQNNAAEQLSQIYYSRMAQSAATMYSPMQNYFNTEFASDDISTGKVDSKLLFLVRYFKWIPDERGISAQILNNAVATQILIPIEYPNNEFKGRRIRTAAVGWTLGDSLWTGIAQPYIDQIVQESGGLGLLTKANNTMRQFTSAVEQPISASVAWNNLTDKQKNDFISATPLTSDQIRTMQYNSLDPTLQALANKALTSENNVSDYVDHMDSIENIRQDFVDAAPEKYINNYNLALAREDDLTDKRITAKVLDKEADNIKYNLEQMKQIGINKMRSAEINTYYAEKYREQVHLVKMLIVIGVCILLLVILNKKGIISGDVSIVLIAIVIVLGTIAFGSRVYNYYRRDNMNYQEFEYGYDSDIEEEEEYDDSIIKTSGKFAGKFCYMDDCCSSGMYYDGDIGKCVDGPAPEGNEQDGTTDADDEQDEDSVWSSAQDDGEAWVDEHSDSRNITMWS
tara:strand:- start:2294 stop:3748 length:1455 start_codon:yes stop_codon:yes gene_type:complete